MTAKPDPDESKARELLNRIAFHDHDERLSAVAAALREARSSAFDECIRLVETESPVTRGSPTWHTLKAIAASIRAAKEKP